MEIISGTIEIELDLVKKSSKGDSEPNYAGPPHPPPPPLRNSAIFSGPKSTPKTSNMHKYLAVPMQTFSGSSSSSQQKFGASQIPKPGLGIPSDYALHWTSITTAPMTISNSIYRAPSTNRASFTLPIPSPPRNNKVGPGSTAPPSTNFPSATTSNSYSLPVASLRSTGTGSGAGSGTGAGVALVGTGAAEVGAGVVGIGVGAVGPRPPVPSVITEFPLDAPSLPTPDFAIRTADGIRNLEKRVSALEKLVRKVAG